MISMIIMDQDNYPTFQYGSEDISDDILEYNFIPIAPLESFLFHSSSSHNLEYFTSLSLSHNLERFTSSSLSYNLECFTLSSSIECSNPLLYTSEYSTLLHYSDQSTLPLDNFENFFTSQSDNLNNSDSSNTLLQNKKKHKSVFVASSTKKPKLRKSWV
ncbi:hypothetical protein F8M41_023954 [Gigaspora margarita]|uniref:Uncharacterized protein n=1 Tax=Gigaspora margarita TaxID=4874 RepID=A0A8H4ACJ1_GIGMA|nr:hypothetical protein F8M41_023954 [Gigaspora margarita]